jgi:hypothetical protein
MLSLAALLPRFSLGGMGDERGREEMGRMLHNITSRGHCIPVQDSNGGLVVWTNWMLDGTWRTGRYLRLVCVWSPEIEPRSCIGGVMEEGGVSDPKCDCVTR